MVIETCRWCVSDRASGREVQGRVVRWWVSDVDRGFSTGKGSEEVIEDGKVQHPLDINRDGVFVEK